MDILAFHDFLYSSPTYSLGAGSNEREPEIKSGCQGYPGRVVCALLLFSLLDPLLFLLYDDLDPLRALGLIYPLLYMSVSPGLIVIVIGSYDAHAVNRGHLIPGLGLENNPQLVRTATPSNTTTSTTELRSSLLLCIHPRASHHHTAPARSHGSHQVQGVSLPRLARRRHAPADALTSTGSVQVHT